MTATNYSTMTDDEFFALWFGRDCPECQRVWMRPVHCSACGADRSATGMWPEFQKRQERAKGWRSFGPYVDKEAKP